MSLGTKHVIELRRVHCARTETGISSSVHGISVELQRGTVTLFSGEEGCGKNLILRLLGLLEFPDAGEVVFRGRTVSKMGNAELMETRATTCGYLFPTVFLLPGFSAMENIAMPLFKVFEMRPIDAQKRTEMLLDFVQLAPLGFEKIEKLSPGLQLRTGLARALGSLPKILIVEEPDRVVRGAEWDAFRALLLQAAERFGTSIAVSTGPGISALPGERQIECVAGKIVADVTL